MAVLALTHAWSIRTASAQRFDFWKVSLQSQLVPNTAWFFDYGGVSVQSAGGTVVTAANAIFPAQPVPVATFTRTDGLTGASLTERWYPGFQRVGALVEAPNHDGYLMVGGGHNLPNQPLFPYFVRVFADGSLKCASWMPALGWDSMLSWGSQITAVVADPVPGHGAYVLAGYSAAFTDGEENPFVAVMDDECNVQWAHGYYCDSGTGEGFACLLQRARLKSVTIGPLGQILAVGSTSTPTPLGTTRRPLLLAVDRATGALQAVRSYATNPQGVLGSEFADIARDPGAGDDVLVLGTLFSVLDPEAPLPSSSRDWAFAGRIHASNSGMAPFGQAVSWHRYRVSDQENAVGRHLAVPPNAGGSAYLGVEASSRCQPGAWNDGYPYTIRLQADFVTPQGAMRHVYPQHDTCAPEFAATNSRRLMGSFEWVPQLPGAQAPSNGLLITITHETENVFRVPNHRSISLLRTNSDASASWPCELDATPIVADLQSDFISGGGLYNSWTCEGLVLLSPATDPVDSQCH